MHDTHLTTNGMVTVQIACGFGAVSLWEMTCVVTQADRVIGQYSQLDLCRSGSLLVWMQSSTWHDMGRGYVGSWTVRTFTWTRTLLNP